MQLQVCCFLSVYNVSQDLDCVHDKTNHSDVTQRTTSIYLKGNVAVSFGNDLLLDTEESKSTLPCCRSQWCGLVHLFLTDDVCNMWTLNETQWYGKQLWHRAECVFASELQFHGLLAPFSIQTLQEQKKKSSYLKDCSSHDMYNWPLTSTDELLALSDVSYIGMEAFQMIVFAVVTSVEYCCTALVKKSNKTLHFFTKLSCAFRIYTARWL